MTGLQRFAATLTERFAGLPPPAVTELADRLTAALRVSVTGRPGVGRRTVAAVLNRAKTGLSGWIAANPTAP